MAYIKVWSILILLCLRHRFKRKHLGVQLDMASYCRLVVNSLIGLARCAVAMKRQRNKTRSLKIAGHDANDQFKKEKMSILAAFFHPKYQYFVFEPLKSWFQIHHHYKGGESTGCLVFVDLVRSFEWTEAIKLYGQEQRYGDISLKFWGRGGVNLQLMDVGFE